MTRKRRVGLLGGSFNPAHAGHRHISLLALKRLRLDEVWWLVATQNPLKPNVNMAPFEQRLGVARAVARDSRICPSDMERDLGTRYTFDTLRTLKHRFPAKAFVWLMGADNLTQICRWREWQRIFALVPIAIFARPTYVYPALAGIAAQRFASCRIGSCSQANLATKSCPAWTFVHCRTHPASSTLARDAADSAVASISSGSPREQNGLSWIK